MKNVDDQNFFNYVGLRQRVRRYTFIIFQAKPPPFQEYLPF